VGDIVDDACDAVVAAGRDVGQISTLILPADVSWADGAPEARRAEIPARPTVAGAASLALLPRVQPPGLTPGISLPGVCRRED